MPEPIECYPFADAANPLRHIGGRQAEYLTRYLATLGAESVIEEPHYFDRDYLAEFAAFYSASARGYPNRCRRLHFFRGNIGRTDLQRMAESAAARDPELDQRYLGFVVLRPIVSAPFGRTVLGWYPDKKQDQPRITAPSRPYVSHLLGRDLSVTGLAWQQQDSAVGACATIALWSITTRFPPRRTSRALRTARPHWARACSRRAGSRSSRSARPSRTSDWPRSS
jgi:hypothetical protein